MRIDKQVKTDNFDKLINIIKELRIRKINIGIFGKEDSHILMIATVQEYGLTIKPKDAQRLAIPVNKKAYGKSPRDFDDLFIIKANSGDLFLCKNKGQDELEFYYWLPTEVTIPERPFIRGTFDNKKDEIDKITKENLDKLFKFEIDTNTFFNRIGQYLAELTKEYLIDLREPANSPVTLIGKAPKTNPLVNTGQLVNSITWKVE